MASKNNSSSIFGIILILALLALNGYQWMKSSQLKQELTSQKSQFLDLEKINTELDFNYQTKLEELEGMRGENQDLNARIDAQKSELAKQKQKISGLIWTQKELGKAKDELTNLNALADQYIAEISKLKSENQVLTSQNVALNEANNLLNDEVSVNKKRISSLDSVQTILVSQKEELDQNNTVLSGKVDIAEAIKVNYLEINGYDVKDGGDLSQKSRAKKVELLRTCLTTETNLITPEGEKEFYIRYTDPLGQIIHIPDAGSGSFTEKLNGEEIRYTTSGTIDYKNKETRACLDFRPNYQLSKGIYKVHVYQNGFEVGKGDFVLK